MIITRKQLRRMILKEFKVSSYDSDDSGIDLIDAGGFPPIDPPEDGGGGGRGGGGGGGKSWQSAYNEMQHRLIPLLIAYFRTGEGRGFSNPSGVEEYSALEAFVNINDKLWEIICAGPFPSGYPEDTNTELPDQFLDVLVGSFGGALPAALHRTQHDDMPLDDKIKNFVGGMRIGRLGTGSDFLLHVGHSWEANNEKVTLSFARVIIAMFNRDHTWPTKF